MGVQRSTRGRVDFRSASGNFSQTANSDLTTITTTGTVDVYLFAPVTGRLESASLLGLDALAANDTNYITVSLTNLSNGSAAMLAVSDLNTTKATGGTAITANVACGLTLHGTVANLNVTANDRIRARVIATGTLANTVTKAAVIGRFKPTTSSN